MPEMLLKQMVKSSFGIKIKSMVIAFKSRRYKNTSAVLYLFMATCVHG